MLYPLILKINRRGKQWFYPLFIDEDIEGQVVDGAVNGPVLGPQIPAPGPGSSPGCAASRAGPALGRPTWQQGLALTSGAKIGTFWRVGGWAGTMAGSSLEIGQRLVQRRAGVPTDRRPCPIC